MANASVSGAVGMMISVISEPSWALVLVGALTLVLILRMYSKKRRLNLPPGPRNLPVIGALLEVKPPMHKAFDRLAAKHGPILHFRVGVQTLVLISSPELAEEVLRHKDHECCDRSTFMNRSSGKYLGFNGRGMVWADYDDEIKLKRKIIVTEFLTGARLRAYEEMRTTELAVMVEKILKEKSAPVEIRKAATGVTVNIMFLLNFGNRFDDLPPTSDHRKVPGLIEERVKILLKLPLVDYFPSPVMEWLDPQGTLKALRRVDKRQREVFGAVLEQHRRERKSATSSGEGHFTNLVDILLRTQEEGGHMTNDAIMAGFASILSAGIDTTAGEVEWAMLELARDPKMLERLQHEIDGVVGRERPVMESDLPAMPFLNAIMVETMRLHPNVPFSFPHVNNKDTTIGKYDIPAKTAVLVNIWSVGRDPRVWKDPLKFNPDRFMVSGQCADHDSWKKFHLLAFGGGRRGCAGLNLAKLVLSRTIATLVHAFDWSPPPGLSTEDLSTEEVGPFLLRPMNDLILTARPRLPAHVYQIKD